MDGDALVAGQSVKGFISVSSCHQNISLPE
jgi:hypothetical protein